jgi:NAD(P)-dependent dehydrogenase (short-subunit alcohol dehydrogenase family)
LTSEIFDLSGRVALITGSSQGLGEATARVLAEHGAHVIISSRRQESCDRVAEEFRADGLSAEALACHIGKEEAITAIYDRISERHGRLDILVNNAVLSPWRKIEDTDRPLMMKALEVNVAGYWYMSAAAAELMKKEESGSIINISSVAARKPTGHLALYSTFKAALDGMTRSFAAEYGRFGLRVNTIIPGLFETELADAFSSEQKRAIQARTPLRRLGRPREVGNAALFLASDASSYITGASLVVDGGQLLAD